MTRHELAKLRFHQLALGLEFGADEERSDQLEAWLRDDIVPVVEDLLNNPVFRRHVREMPEQLFASPPSDRRLRIDAFAAALVAEAQTLVTVAREFNLVEALADHDRDLDEAWIAEEAGHGIDTRSTIEKLAERPWFDMANREDVWTPSMDLFLRRPDALLTRQYRRRRSDWELLGDHIIDLMFERFDFWKQRLERGRHRLESRLVTDQSTFAARERMFACVIDVDRTEQAVRRDWREGSEARLRKACLVLLQTYIAYHAVPQLPWLDFDSRRLEVIGHVVRKFFRHRGTLRLVEQTSDGRLQTIGTRSASLVDAQLIRQVAAAIEDLSELYHRGVHADDLIAEAKDRFRLVVVVSPRMVFWNGQVLELPWNGAEKSWNLLLHLAVKTEGVLPLRDFGLTGVKTSRDLIIRKSHLDKFLSRAAAGAELAVRIEKTRGGDCRLDLKPTEVKVLDLQADDWTVDVSEFAPANSLAENGGSRPTTGTPRASAKPR